MHTAPTPAQTLRNRAARLLRQKHDPHTPVASPCSGVCRMDAASGLCVGCWRTLDEIAAWSQMDNAAKLAVWRKLKERCA